MTYVFVIILAAMVVWAITAFNRLIALQGQTLNGWKQIDVQLKRRHDLIPNLVNAVKGAMEFEKETLEAVISARNQAVKIQADALPTGGVQALAQAEANLRSALSRLNVGTSYNVLQQQFPWSLLTGFAKAVAVELWEITDEKDREVPNVDLSMT